MNDAARYQACMHEIKSRLVATRQIAATPLYRDSQLFSYEGIAIHLRKCLELVAFSSLVANKTAYSQVFKNYHVHWRAKDLLASVAKVHSDFYPKPIEYDSTNEEGVKHYRDAPSGYLTKDEFVFLYDKCSEVLHVWNPFSEKERRIDFKHAVPEWVDKIDRLLRFHYVRMSGKGELWVVDMYYPPDGTVHTFIAPPHE